MVRIFTLVFVVVAFVSARENIVFNGVVRDTTFDVNEKLNVEILETGEALQTTVGKPFSVVLPEDTLWNVCVTNSDTAGAEKEKCYELVYLGTDSTFSMTLGEEFVLDERGETRDDYHSGLVPGRETGDESGESVDVIQSELKDSV